MIVTVYATFADRAEAERVARLVVEERLAACANILAPCQSIYRWEGKMEDAEEIPVLFKTAAAQAQLLIERIVALHSYDVPAAVVWPAAQALPAFAAWVEEETRPAMR
jgi:periplasmic divalent cation tolerance protein